MDRDVKLLVSQVDEEPLYGNAVCMGNAIPPPPPPPPLLLLLLLLRRFDNERNIRKKCKMNIVPSDRFYRHCGVHNTGYAVYFVVR